MNSIISSCNQLLFVYLFVHQRGVLIVLPCVQSKRQASRTFYVYKIQLLLRFYQFKNATLYIYTFSQNSGPVRGRAIEMRTASLKIDIIIRIIEFVLLHLVIEVRLNPNVISLVFVRITFVVLAD